MINQVQHTKFVCLDYCDTSYVVKLVALSFSLGSEISMEVLWKEYWHRSLEILLT